MRRGGGVAGAEECTQSPLPSPLTPPSLPSQPPASGVRQWKIPRAQPSAEMVENRGGRTMTALKKKEERNSPQVWNSIFFPFAHFFHEWKSRRAAGDVHIRTGFSDDWYNFLVCMSQKMEKRKFCQKCKIWDQSAKTSRNATVIIGSL